ncbi:MAG TPA: metallophosphoesterase [Actinomycetota bacterium]|nr:metallophosphoesterase [Actinomycetota bacterium]
MAATAALLTRTNLAAVLTLGDNQYELGEPENFLASYDPTWGRVKGITHPSPGNHDYYTAGAAGYFGYFGAAAGDPQRGYYSLDVGRWHLVSLNSECAQVGGCHAGSPQEVWLRADLAAHPTQCTLGYWHHPRFGSSGVGHEHAQPAMSALWEVLHGSGADVVLSGHAHNYERLAPQDATGRFAPEDGIRSFVVGTGGKDLEAFGAIAANSEVRSSEAFGVIELALHPTRYAWRFVSAQGSMFTDAGSGRCR